MENSKWMKIEDFNPLKYESGTYVNARVEYDDINRWDIYIGWIVGVHHSYYPQEVKSNVVNSIYFPYLPGDIKKFKITHICIIPELDNEL